MLYATKIRMSYGYYNSKYPEDISHIYIHGHGWYKRVIFTIFLSRIRRPSLLIFLPTPI